MYRFTTCRIGLLFAEECLAPLPVGYPYALP